MSDITWRGDTEQKQLKKLQRWIKLSRNKSQGWTTKMDSPSKKKTTPQHDTNNNKPKQTKINKNNPPEKGKRKTIYKTTEPLTKLSIIVYKILRLLKLSKYITKSTHRDTDWGQLIFSNDCSSTQLLHWHFFQKLQTFKSQTGKSRQQALIPSRSEAPCTWRRVTG